MKIKPNIFYVYNVRFPITGALYAKVPLVFFNTCSRKKFGRNK